MDSTSLKTASTYINNLLLARGLLRSSEPISFEQARNAKGKDGDATMAKIMNLVHDMILRRDREQSHHQKLTTTLRALQSESSQSTTRFTRLQSSHDALARQLSLAETTTRNAQALLKKSETYARGLEKEIQKQKQRVAEVRKAAEKDVRRRDETIKGLRAHLTARQRGSKGGLIGANVSVTPGSSTSSNHTGGGGGAATRGKGNDDVDLADPGYSLKQETTEFLTQLSQSLSDENDGLIALLRGAVGEVKGLLGMEEGKGGRKNGGVVQNGNGMEQMHVQRVEEEEDTSMVNALPTSYEALAADIETVISQLREVLTSPNFVSLEEVEVRDEEIGILRHGWEKMEARWRDAVAMMEGWRERIERKGDTVRLEDLKMGLDLGEGLEDLASVAGSTRKRRNGRRTSIGSTTNIAGEDSQMDEGTKTEWSNIEVVERTVGSDTLNFDLLSRPQPLREAQGNARSPRRVSFMPTLEDVVDENSEVDVVGSAPDLSPGKVFNQSPQRQAPKRLSSPHPSERASKLLFSSDLSEGEDDQGAEDEQEDDQLSIQEKLKAAQAEAEAAAKARIKQAEEEKIRLEEEKEAKADRVGSPVKAVKRTRIGGRPKRRKSTLTPDELMGLLGD
ncbi:MAG: hypothetical protein M1820_007139 [Bogoriella megaspora]|nr:MAG: hypothetical protein M1820_007139 [Bogoriella megaspora]